ncbi:MAG: hypothetical protein GXP53_04585 [Deltaproteobacteria bacterium]|nr:hypothetical protein [Deltaproteobacteria bacterium]
MIDIDKNTIMTDEGIRNCRNFLKKLKEDSVNTDYYPLESFDGWGAMEPVFGSIKIIDRRREDDPTYQGYYALESLDRRRGSAPVFKNSRKVEWKKYAARDFLGEALYY